MEDFSHTLSKLRKRLGLTQTEMAEKMGLSLSYIHQLENGKRTPSANVVRLLEMLDSKQAAGFDIELNEAYSVRLKKSCRMVPVLGMAHAGEVIDYEEIERASAEFVPTLCQDEKAFGLSIQGDSMFPKIKDQDTVILSPSVRPYNGCIVVARITGEGVVCRAVETVGGMINLIPANERYMAAEYNENDFDWMYVVYGTWTQIYRE